MAFLTSGGSLVTTSEIVDSTIVNADIAAAAAIAQSKIAAQANNNTDIVSVERTVGTTHSLTTVAGQKVTVIASGWHQSAGTDSTLNLKYNGVTKASATFKLGNTQRCGFCLQYQEVPGAATQNITVADADANEVTITVIKTKA